MLRVKNRPYLIHFHNLLVDHQLSIRVGISSRPIKFFKINSSKPSVPIKDFRLLKKNNFSAIIKIEDQLGQTKYESKVETDQFGHLNLRMSLPQDLAEIIQDLTINVYEDTTLPGFDLLLGKSKINQINPEKEILISDFDKTLVDTKYKTTVELYHSLTSPLETFPTVESTLKILTPLLKDENPFFVVSASPHFYEASIRDWLKKQKINDLGIFLKDYRHFLSFQNTELFSKDIKVHGTFKLSQLLTLVYMLDIPKKLVLFGDSSETDTLIYVLFFHILTEMNDVTTEWEKIKHLEAFKLTDFQDTKLLNRLHLIQTKKRVKNYKPRMKIYIRKINPTDKPEVPEWLSPYLDNVTFY